jgi:hypothetical protein
VERLVEQIDSNGGGASLSKNAGEIDGLIQTWQTRLALPHFYGNSRPSLYYLHKHESDFLQD